MSTQSMKAYYSSALVAEQRKRYMRTPAERLLMAWVFCWMMLALVATCVMLYLLIILYRRPALSSDNFSMLEMNKKLTRETYHSKDPVTQALLKRITAKDINTTLEILIKTPSGGYPLAEGVLKYWKSHGMEETKIVKYQALMSIPDETQPNKAPVVYVNYARTYDFEQLEERQISVRGKVVIARTGQITKGFKVKNAERAGAAGVVLFLDRVENGPQDLYKAFPDSVYVSGSAIQRGTVSYYRGDPLTPGYPGVGELAFFSRRLHVKTHDKLVDGYAYNAIGMIMGGVEPDRYVLMGSHMSWQSRGDANPLLALSQLVVQGKTFANLHKRGWKPRRTMVFALWDGDADSLLGSTEWVEDKMRLLQQGAIIYIANDLITDSEKLHWVLG
ncbi:N-acetylated-alpha-linked acidic dipeptidase 2-like [Ixodes scapularis]|uniref:N-acetylated-alpha-linked acidic dipeptidase 2-like n=1 Tax=Ixodes scapularis TaxID=6945 RepID=UPI001C3841D3|nr:N-acetylated-alpha-linked acidic dipeptidase 2-like [Ixodes scapularis]